MREFWRTLVLDAVRETAGPGLRPRCRDLARDVLERQLRRDDEAPHPKETIPHREAPPAQRDSLLKASRAATL
jgi:hypothetical protein